MVTIATHRGQTIAVDTDIPVSFYRHGWHSWSPTGWVDPLAQVRPIADESRRLVHDDPVHAPDARVGGSGVGAVEHGDGTITLVASLDAGARIWPDGSVLRGLSEGATADWVVISGDELDVWTECASQLAARYGRRGGDAIRVWCSWYSFYEEVTEAAVEVVLDGLDGLPFDIVQVDDGWERAVGDWTPNAGFPGGMSSVAGKIRSRGFTAGLWLAPLIAQSTSDLAAERPELLLRDDQGAPVVAGIYWGSPYFALDPTAAATQEFLADLMSTVRGWGYDYLKLDFLYGGAFPGVHANPMPRELAYRRACEVMREAAGDDCYLLACGAPVLASLGIFDGIRIGPDVDEVWEVPELAALGDESGRGARNALATSVDRLWLRDVLDVDPDVIYLRRDVDLERSTIEALKDMARISRFVGLSDPPDSLDAEAHVELQRLLTEDPGIIRLGRYTWEIDGRPVDFSWVRSSRGSPAHPEGGP